MICCRLCCQISIKTISKVPNTQPAMIGTADRTFSTFKGKSKSAGGDSGIKMELQATSTPRLGKNTISTEANSNSSRSRNLKPPSSSQKKTSKITMGSSLLQNSSITQYVPQIVTVRSEKKY